MATLLGSLLISLGLDSGQFRTGMSQAERDMVKFQKRMEKSARAMQDLGARMTIGITAPLAAFGAFSVKAASDAAELQSAFNETFGSLSKGMTDWAETTGDAMGRSTQEIQQAATTFGIFFNQAAPTKKAAADLSKEFSILAQDLSSFFNTDPTEAMQKLRSGLAGESEPLRDFGVFLDEATVKAKAMEMGLASSADAVSQQNKIMARAALIMEATTTAQGDVARTADGTANKIRSAAAAFDELKVVIGEKLMPAVRPLIDTLTGLLQGFSALPAPMQGVIVALAAIAAATGPIVYLAGSLKLAMVTLAGAFVSNGVAAAAATPALTGFRGALMGIASTIAPLTIAFTVIVSVLGAVAAAARNGRKANGQYAEQLDAVNQISARVRDVTKELAAATGEARKAALENAKALREEAKQALSNARAKVAAAKATYALAAAQAQKEFDVTRRVGGSLTRDQFGGTGIAIDGPKKKEAEQARVNLDAANRAVAAAEREVGNLTRSINALAPIDISPAVSANTGGTTASAKPTGPDPVEIERQHQQALAAIRREELQARIGLADSIFERTDLSNELLLEEYVSRRTAIEEDVDLSQDQRDAQIEALRTLYGINAEMEKKNHLVIDGNTGLLREALFREEAAELERQAEDTARDRYDLERDMLGIQASLADTDKERKDIALQLLELEQRYRRSRLEAVLASEVAGQAEKDRARAILASLPGLEAGERRQTERANETEIERYVRSVNLSADEINQAIGDIQIDGLEALNEGLIDVIKGVKSLGEVFANVANQIISDLLRIAIRKAIIAPLANMIFGGGGGGLGGLLGGTDHGGGHLGGGLDSWINGKRAMGGPVLAGGAYLVGERGPEIFRPASSGSIIPNHELTSGSSRGELAIRLGAGLEAEWLQKSGLQSVEILKAAAPGVMQGAATKARRDAARPVTPGGLTG